MTKIVHLKDSTYLQWVHGEGDPYYELLISNGCYDPLEIEDELFRQHEFYKEGYFRTLDEISRCLAVTANEAKTQEQTH